MKCAIDYVRHQREVELLDKQENKATAYAIALALRVAEDMFGYNPADLQELLHGMYETASEGFDYYRDDKAARYDTETVPFIEYGFKRHLIASDCDVSAVEAQFAFTDEDMPETAKKNRQLRAKFKGRKQILEDREMSLRPYFYSFLTYMAEDMEISGEDLTKYYTAIRKEYREVWLKYLELAPESDARLAGIVNGLLSVMKDKGIDIDTRTNKERDEDERKAKEEREKENG